MNERDVQAYVKRIRYFGPLEPTVEVLHSLQKQHLLHVPFENLDIHCENPIILDIDKFYRKIVRNHRGGFCYELNGLFCALLQQIGFNVIRVSARVYEHGAFSEEFDHLALVVAFADSSYLVDVGFGDFSFLPLDIHEHGYQWNKNGGFTTEIPESNRIVVNKLVDGITVPQYTFLLIDRPLTDFTIRCQYHQSNPGSHFTQQKLISIDTEEGRITLTDKKLKIRKFDKVEELLMHGAVDFESKLQEIFDLSLRDIVKKHGNQTEL